MNEQAKAETHTSDVLVIGGGGAALIAACRAAELGASVRVVSKKRPGIASCTAYAGGGFTVAVEGMTEQEHRTMTLETGRGLNDPRLVQTLTENGESALEYLEGWGVSFRRRRGGASVRAGVSNPLLGGTGLTYPLLERCRELGVVLHHPVRIRRLLQEDFGGAVLGAEGQRRGRLEHFSAAATVLATGGGGWIYRRTDNPAGITGDGYSLALRAGARLRDMEFVQFYPLGSAPEKGAPWYVGAAILDHARLTDGTGEEFLPGLMEEWGLTSGRQINQLARDRLSRAIELRRSSTDRVLLHLEDVPQDLRTDPNLHHTVSLVSGRRADPWGPVEVAPIQHFMSGGVVMDTRGCTDVPGLFACGEVTGGVHGANRVGGNALTELAVFGLRAGEAAARSAGEVPARSDTMRLRPLGPVIARDPTGKEEGLPPFSVGELRRQTDQLLGPLRDDATLRCAGRLLGAWHPAHPGDEEAFMLQAARCIAAAALAREESRGCHYRDDFPEETGADYVVYLVPEPASDSPAVFVRPETAGVHEERGWSV